MIDMKKIRDLVKLMITNDLTELDLECDGERITLKRGPGQSSVHFVAPPQAVVSNGGGVAEPPDGGGGADRPPAEPASASDGSTIASPMVGTYYAAPSPDAKPFISVGDRVGPETVVCIIEAMKVFNEIKAEASGTIQKVLVENGQAVEFGQALFEVKPS